MTRITVLKCSKDQYHGIISAVDSARGKKVPVDRAALDALLADHAKLISLFKSQLGGEL